jgi:hypothetical protein
LLIIFGTRVILELLSCFGRKGTGGKFGLLIIFGTRVTSGSLRKSVFEFNSTIGFDCREGLLSCFGRNGTGGKFGLLIIFGTRVTSGSLRKSVFEFNSGFSAGFLKFLVHFSSPIAMVSLYISLISLEITTDNHRQKINNT